MPSPQALPVPAPQLPPMPIDAPPPIDAPTAAPTGHRCPHPPQPPAVPRPHRSSLPPPSDAAADRYPNRIDASTHRSLQPPPQLPRAHRPPQPPAQLLFGRFRLIIWSSFFKAHAGRSCSCPAAQPVFRSGGGGLLPARPKGVAPPWPCMRHTLVQCTEEPPPPASHFFWA
jgi:hypothetical protein